MIANYVTPRRVELVRGVQLLAVYVVFARVFWFA